MADAPPPPLTNVALEDIIARYEATQTDWAGTMEWFRSSEDVPSLLAEVARLREALQREQERRRECYEEAGRLSKELETVLRYGIGVPGRRDSL